MHPVQVIALWLTVPAVLGVVAMGYGAFTGVGTEADADRVWPFLVWGLRVGAVSMALALVLAVVGGRLHERRGGRHYPTDWAELRPLGIGAFSIVVGGVAVVGGRARGRTSTTRLRRPARQCTPWCSQLLPK